MLDRRFIILGDGREIEACIFDKLPMLLQKSKAAFTLIGGGFGEYIILCQRFS